MRKPLGTFIGMSIFYGSGWAGFLWLLTLPLAMFYPVTRPLILLSRQARADKPPRPAPTPFP